MMCFNSFLLFKNVKKVPFLSNDLLIGMTNSLKTVLNKVPIISLLDLIPCWFQSFVKQQEVTQ